MPARTGLETVDWSGACVDGYANGNGTIQWFLDEKPNGSYMGDVVAGKETGRGIQLLPNGMRYEGQFLEGRKQGRGTIFYPSGDKLEGIFAAGRLAGTGTITRSTGETVPVMDRDGKIVRVTPPVATPSRPATDSPSSVPSSSASLPPVYFPTQNPQLRATAIAAQNSRFLEKVQGIISRGTVLPTPVRLVARECGGVNAQYDPATRTISLCYELLAKISTGITAGFGGRNSPDTVSMIANGTFMWIALHEFGHAMFHLLQVPVFGREEDAADQLATFLILQAKDTSAASQMLVGVHWFFSNRARFQNYANEHSTNEQRQFNIACWAYGKNPSAYVALARYALLPQDRAVRCEAEYQQMSRTIQKLLGNNLRGVQY